MSQKDKLYKKIFEEKDINYDEAEKLLLSLHFTKRTPKGGSSHVTFTKPPYAITLVKTQNPVKKYLLKQLKEILQNE